MADGPSSIGRWADRTFGESTIKARWARVEEEVKEARAKLKEVEHGNLDDFAEELADIYITLCGVAQTAGIDLTDEINRKMHINRGRKWKLRGDGTGQHE